MATLPFEITLSGDDADEHQMPAYDGFSSLAGVSLATTLITNYALTGKIRRRGQFEARSNVRFTEYREGSLVFGFVVEYAVSHPWVWQLGGTMAVGLATNALYDLMKHTVKKNIGQFHEPETAELKTLLDKKEGDLEALAAAAEPNVRCHN